MMLFTSVPLLALFALGSPAAEDVLTGGLVDRAEELGLGVEHFESAVARVAFVDFDADGFPDLLVDRWRIFMNRPDEETACGRCFVEVAPEKTGLARPDARALAVAADLDNDGFVDLVLVESVDAQNPSWEDHGRRTRVRLGCGDGTFAPALPIAGLRPATTSAVAVGDLNRDGRLDLFLGNWYTHYGASYLGYANDLCLQSAGEELAFDVSALPEGAVETGEVDVNLDLAGRPTYGAMIASLEPTARPVVLEMNYGRRWNRLWRWREEAWHDDGPSLRFDGDDVRSASYPRWAVERFEARKPPIVLEPELPFRSNGNSFDVALGDVDRDGDFDVFVSEITHAWAGNSADRSALLLSQLETGTLGFLRDAAWSLDRIPEGLEAWNQGDLFGAFADLDHDGWLELFISSGDYPDDQRLRVFSMGPDGPRERTAEWGLDHDGSQQLSLGDIDGDGDLDVVVGQTFNRFTKEQREGRKPSLVLYVNEVPKAGTSVELFFEGDGEHVSRDAIGVVCEAHVTDADGEVTLVRQLVGPGGHAGKADALMVHFGLGPAERIERLVVRWPDALQTVEEFGDVAPGRYRVVYRLEDLQALDPSK
jgi:hypothetical protein